MRIALNSLILHAQPTRGGFFGLTELDAFARLILEPDHDVKDMPTLLLDFSDVRVWDIAALLWLIVALHHYRRNAGIPFILRLPEGQDGMDVKEWAAADKSADYLRRWRFDKGLSIIDPDIRTLLVPDQQDYFSPPEPRKYYQAQKVYGESGLLQSLVSRGLAEIRNISDPAFTGSAPISPKLISQCIREFQAERIGDILAAQCGIEKRKADLFSDHLLTEALLNIQEHPNASIGMVAISLMGNTNELVLSVVDNGDSIAQTIYQRFLSDGLAPPDAPQEYNRILFSDDERLAIANHATQKGITRKTGPEAAKAGMGLTYIKEDSVATFNGKFTIVTDGLRITYQNNPALPPEVKKLQHSWRGNLLRIAIPLSKQTNVAESAVA